MKQLLMILFAFFPAMLCAKTDSTTIFFKHIENDDMITICKLADIQILKVVCYDTTLRNKVFNVVVREFDKGKVIDSIDLGIKNEIIESPFIVGKDTMIYVMNMVEKAGIHDDADSIMITFSGLFKNDKFKLSIRYPGIEYHKVLRGEDNYLLREAISCANDSIRVPINQSFPILAYTPPTETGEGGSYCLLGEENLEDWYSKLKVKHFYGIYLEIK